MSWRRGFLSGREDFGWVRCETGACVACRSRARVNFCCIVLTLEPVSPGTTNMS